MEWNCNLRRSAAESFRVFCESMLGDYFRSPWSLDQLKAIEAVQTYVAVRRRFVTVRLERGKGKSTFTKAAALWSAHRSEDYTLVFTEHARCFLRSIASALDQTGMDSEARMKNYRSVTTRESRIEAMGLRCSMAGLHPTHIFLDDPLDSHRGSELTYRRLADNLRKIPHGILFQS